MFKLIYFRSVYAEIPVSISFFRDYDLKIERNLEEIKEKCRLEMETRDLSIDLEELLYENYIRHNYLLLDNLQILFDHGINVSKEVFSKGKRRNINLSSSLFIFYEGKVIVILKGNPLSNSDGLIQFLERVKEDCSFLNVLQVTEGKNKAPRKERDIIIEFSDKVLKSRGYSIYKSVKEINLGEKVISIFPDIDLIAVKDEEVLCFEAKATSETKNLYTALGEAMYYLVVEDQKNGGFCDKVYILLPEEPKDERAKTITSLTPIGIMLVNGEVILEAKENPYLNLNLKKEILSLNLLEKYKLNLK